MEMRDAQEENLDAINLRETTETDGGVIYAIQGLKREFISLAISPTNYS
jgi:hypothetical protein